LIWLFEDGYAMVFHKLALAKAIQTLNLNFLKVGLHFVVVANYIDVPMYIFIGECSINRRLSTSCVNLMAIVQGLD
jgi:hypothetical protein